MLAKDVVCDLFFLIDDAFRFGETMIRRAALKAKAFRENGIHAVPKPLTGISEAAAPS